MGEVGENVTTYNTDATSQTAFAAQMAERSVHDGHVATSALNYGWAIGQNGFLRFPARSATDRERTARCPTPARNTCGRSAQCAHAADQSLAGRFVQSRQEGFFNAGTTLRNGMRHTRSVELGIARCVSGFWRRANDDRTVRALYPDGFLPFIKSRSTTGRFPAGGAATQADGSGISARSTGTIRSTSRSTTRRTCPSDRRRRHHSTPASSRSVNRRPPSIFSAKSRAHGIRRFDSRSAASSVATCMRSLPARLTRIATAA